MAEEPPEKKARIVHFGSLEEQERRRLEEGSGAEEKDGISAAVLAGIRAGNINIADR